jgi:hypothetical protein
MKTAYEIEEENLKKNILYSNKKILDKKIIKITEELFSQAEMELFIKQDKAQRRESRRQIDKLKEDLCNDAELPAIALRNFRYYLHIADGLHRVMALYELNIREHPALIIEV